MKRHLGPGRSSPPAGFEPASPLTEVGSANRSATRTFRTLEMKTILDIYKYVHIWMFYIKAVETSCFLSKGDFQFFFALFTLTGLLTMA